MGHEPPTGLCQAGVVARWRSNMTHGPSAFYQLHLGLSLSSAGAGAPSMVRTTGGNTWVGCQLEGSFCRAAARLRPLLLLPCAACTCTGICTPRMAGATEQGVSIKLTPHWTGKSRKRSASSHFKDCRCDDVAAMFGQLS